MRQSVKLIISLVIRMILLTLCALVFTFGALNKLPEWCSMWWMLVFYVLYVISVVYHELKLKR